MAGLAYHNFVSAAVGIALAVAFIRGIARRERETIGNFWVDTTRALLWILLPVCVVVALVFVSQGVVQNLKPYDVVSVVEGTGTQTIAQGPVASQEAIKQFGTNGGGFFNANSAHPFENPTPATNFLAMFLIFVIPAGLTWTLGDMTGSRRHGWAVWAAMAFLFAVGVSVTYWAEARGNPLLAGLDQQASAVQSGGNMEGKEVRFGIANSALFATVTTDASCGAVNAMHDSFTPLGGLVPLTNILLGEVIFGGVGAGLYGILIFIILTVFIAGLMVGRTPEYLGKKIEAFDVKMAMLAVLIFPLTILTLSGIAVISPSFGTSSLLNQGPHGLTRDSVRVHLGDREQRLGLRRTLREHALVQHHARHRDAPGPVHGDHSDARPRRKPCSQEDRAALARHVSRDDPVVRDLAGRRHRHRRRADVLSRRQPWPDRRRTVAP